MLPEPAHERGYFGPSRICVQPDGHVTVRSIKVVTAAAIEALLLILHYVVVCCQVSALLESPRRTEGESVSQTRFKNVYRLPLLCQTTHFWGPIANWGFVGAVS